MDGPPAPGVMNTPHGFNLISFRAPFLSLSFLGVEHGNGQRLSFKLR